MGKCKYLLISSRHGGTFGDSGDLTPLLFGKHINPIPIRRAMHKLFPT